MRCADDGVLPRATLAWVGMVAVAFLNGAMRELLLAPFLSAQLAQKISVLTLIALCTVYVWAVWRPLRVPSAKAAVYVGLLWLLLTGAFETLVMNRVVGGMSWREILTTYDVVGGQYWPIALLWIGALPWLRAVVVDDPRQAFGSGSHH